MYIINVEGAIYHEGKWLIIKRSEQEEHAPGMLSLVGGKVESKGFNDDVLELALIREIKEEVDIEIWDIHYLESKTFMTDQGEAVVDIVFTCHYASGTPRCVSNEEVSEIHWMSTNEILNNEKAPDYLKETIKKADLSINPA